MCATPERDTVTERPNCTVRIVVAVTTRLAVAAVTLAKQCAKKQTSTINRTNNDSDNWQTHCPNAYHTAVRTVRPSTTLSHSLGLHLLFSTHTCPSTGRVLTCKFYTSHLTTQVRTRVVWHTYVPCIRTHILTRHRTYSGTDTMYLPNTMQTKPVPVQLRKIVFPARANTKQCHDGSTGTHRKRLKNTHNKFE